MQNEQIENYNEPLKVALDNLSSENQPQSPDNPQWHSLVGIGVWLASVFFIVLIPLILVIPYAVVNRGNGAEELAKDPNLILLNVIGIIPAHILTLLLAWFVVTKYNKYSFLKSLGWEWGGFRWWHFVLILAAFFGFAALVSTFFPEQENDLIKILRSSRMAVYFVAFIATFGAPIVEEVVYRGVLFSPLQKNNGTTFAVVLTTFLFALVHVPQYYPSYSTIILICLLSLILTLIRVKTKNLLPCVVLHFIFNGLQSVGLIFEPYLTKLAEQAQQPAGFILYLLK